MSEHSHQHTYFIDLTFSFKLFQHNYIYLTAFLICQAILFLINILASLPIYFHSLFRHLICLLSLIPLPFAWSGSTLYSHALFVGVNFSKVRSPNPKAGRRSGTSNSMESNCFSATLVSSFLTQGVSVDVDFSAVFAVSCLNHISIYFDIWRSY